MKAARGGHLPVVKGFLAAAHADAHRRADDGCNCALHVAAKGGRGETGAELLDYDADMDANDLDGELPLMSAAKAGNGRTAQLLLTADADINIRDQIGCSAFDHAEAKGYARILNDILFTRRAPATPTQWARSRLWSGRSRL